MHMSKVHSSSYIPRVAWRSSSSLLTRFLSNLLALFLIYSFAVITRRLHTGENERRRKDSAPIIVFLRILIIALSLFIILFTDFTAITNRTRGNVGVGARLWADDSNPLLAPRIPAQIVRIETVCTLAVTDGIQALFTRL